MLAATDARNLRPGDVVVFNLGDARIVRAVDRIEAEWVEVVWAKHVPTVHRGLLNVIVPDDPAYVERERQREVTGGDPW